MSALVPSLRSAARFSASAALPQAWSAGATLLEVHRRRPPWRASR